MADFYKQIVETMGTFLWSLLGFETHDHSEDDSSCHCIVGCTTNNRTEKGKDTAVYHINGTIETINISPTTTYAHDTSSELESVSASETDFINKWIDETNKKTMQEVQKDIAVLFPFLSEPKTRETPQLYEIDYYRGCGSLLHAEYSPRNSFSAKTSRKTMGHLVSLNQIHSGVGQEDTRHVMLLGSAGAGKTTLIKRYAKMALLKNIDRLKHVRLVIYMEFRKLCFNERVTAQDVFMNYVSPHLEEREKKAAFSWMKRNSQSILFAIDGFDQAVWSLDGQHSPLGYDTLAEINTIMYNIFNRHLFPYSWLLTSSRDHAIQKLVDKVRPDKTIELAGLTKKSVENLVKGYGGKKGDEIWQKLSSMKSEIKSFCAIPVFLVFTTSALYEQDENPFPCDTFSGVMLRVLLNLIHSQHSHKSNTIDVLQKLQKMAFAGIQEGKVLFRIPDLEKVGLRYEEVHDLVVTMPGQSKCQISQRFVEGSNIIFFCHQSVQETLAALYISQMSPHVFEHFVHEELNKPRWSVVRLLVYGSILHPDTSPLKREICKEISGVCNYTEVEKQDILIRNLQHFKTVGLDLLTVLHEAGEGANEAIESSAGDINLSSTRLTARNMYMLATVALRRLVVRELNFRDCDLNPQLLEDLMTALMGSEIKVYSLDMMGNKHLGQAGFRALGAILKQCKVEHLNIEDCNLDANLIKSIRKGVEEKEEPLTSLNVCWNQTMKFDGFVELGYLIKAGRVKNIRLRRCDLASRELTGIELALKRSGCLIDMLDVSENYTLTTDCCRIIGDIASRHKVHELLMDDCNLTSREIESLERSLINSHAHLNVLKMGVNKALNRNALHSIGRIIALCNVRELHVRHCELTYTDLCGFYDAIKGGLEQKLVTLDIGWNRSLGKAGFYLLGKIINEAKVENVIMDNCEVTACQLHALGQEMRRPPLTQLKTLDMSYNELGNKHFDALYHFLDKVTEKLKLSADSIESVDLHSFADDMSKLSSGLYIEWN